MTLKIDWAKAYRDNFEIEVSDDADEEEIGDAVDAMLMENSNYGSDAADDHLEKNEELEDESN